MGSVDFLRRGFAHCEDDCSDVVVEARCSYGLLMCFRRASLLAKNETGADPDGAGTQHKRSSQRLAVEKATSSDNLDILAGQWALVALAHLRHRWDQNGSRHVTSVSTSLATLSTYNVGTHIEAFLDMLRMSNHVHIEYASFV